MTPDHRDLVIETLAESEAELREDVVRYRLLLTQAFDCIHAQHARIDGLVATNRRLCRQLGTLRSANGGP